MKKKTFSCLLTLSLVLSLILSGCGGSQNTTKPADQGTTAQKGSSSTTTPPATNEQKETAKNSSAKPEELGERLAKAYTAIMASGKYYMKQRMTLDGEKIEAEVAYNGDDFATKTLSKGIENRMIIKDNKTYVIDPAQKMVMIMNSTDNKQKKAVNYSGITFVREGKGDFLGKTLPYEEYSADGGSTKYFFDGKKLAGIESNQEGKVQVLEVLELSDKIPAGLFEIPKDYVQQNLGK